MTIRKQFTILSLLLILIPVVCAGLIRLQAYIMNSKRVLINGTQQLEQFDSKNLSPEDFNNLVQTIKVLPPDVQCLVYDGKKNIIAFSSIPEFPTNSNVSIGELLDFLRDTSDEFLYQFTTPFIDIERNFFVTRIPKQKHKPQKRNNFINKIMLVMCLFIIICFLMIIFISRTIFKSIIKIDAKTQQLAEGNLSEQIFSENDNPKINEITSILISLEKMRLSIIEVMNRKNKFIMGISHDLRTPVAIIKGYSEAILDDVITDKEEIKNSVQLIQNRTTQLSEMIDTLLNYMRLNETEIREKLTEGSICTLIKDFTNSALLTSNVFKRNFISNVNLPEDVLVPLDSQLVIRSFENLLSNALRYTNDNDTIEIISNMDKNNVYFSIKDTGIGIEEKDLPVIFDMFYRGTNSRREEGLGIGLSVVKNIIDIHGWTITVNSKKNEGTCFTITIPIK